MTESTFHSVIAEQNNILKQSSENWWLVWLGSKNHELTWSSELTPHRYSKLCLRSFFSFVGNRNDGISFHPHRMHRWQMFVTDWLIDWLISCCSIQWRHAVCRICSSRKRKSDDCSGNDEAVEKYWFWVASTLPCDCRKDPSCWRRNVGLL